MRIVVLNGSPKGEQSVTMQYVAYLEKVLPGHGFEIISISQKIMRLERKTEEFDRVMNSVRKADAVLWAFPVYYTLVPSQYKRFIELIHERETSGVLQGKHAAALTTSIHFFDHTAHQYIRAVCEDLGMKYYDGYSADMNDLFNEEDRRQIRLFARGFIQAIEADAPAARMTAALSCSDFVYRDSSSGVGNSLDGMRAAIITDCQKGDDNLGRMIERFRSSFKEEFPLYNLHDLGIKGGCLGCLQCAYDNDCRYEDVDGYIDFYRNVVMKSDILVLAGRTRDRFLSATWKCFFDRSFFKTHTPTLAGKQIGMIVSGPYSQLHTLQQSIQGWFEIHPANRVGAVSDECADSSLIDCKLDDLGAKLVHAARVNEQRPVSFLGVGGQKLFRDEVYGRLRGVFQADHRAYRRLGWYDFPARSLTLRQRLMTAVMTAAQRIKPAREQFQKRIVTGMIAPYERLLERIEK